MENKETTVSIHRVGTTTCGIILVLYGVLFVTYDSADYELSENFEFLQ